LLIFYHHFIFCFVIGLARGKTTVEVELTRLYVY